jgi:hypothetical protein
MLSHMFNSQVIQQQVSTGFFDANAMARAGGKKLQRYMSNKGSIAWINALHGKFCSVQHEVCRFDLPMCVCIRGT